MEEGESQVAHTRRLRIAIVVHGRFYAFDLARELLRRGHDVTLFTNYPAFVAARFGVPPRRVCSFITHGVLGRVARKLFPGGLNGRIDRVMNTRFGRWAARVVPPGDWDAAYCFSGVCEELFHALDGRPTLRFLTRGSSHILTQRRLLEEEQARAKAWTDKPSDWMVAREQREYALADAIHVFGSFPRQSFLDHGADTAKLYPIRLGVSIRDFQATPAVMEERLRRIRAGEPLRLLNVGTFCLRKGAVDFLELFRRCDPGRFLFRLVGPISPDAVRLLRSAECKAVFTGKRPQADLPVEYAWGDLFLLPTLEDGFPVVVPQALAGALPVLTTPHSGAADLIEDGRNGWVLPVRRPDLFSERLRWCDAHREELAEMVRASHRTGVAWDWEQTAQQTEQAIIQALEAKTEKARRRGAVSR